MAKNNGNAMAKAETAGALDAPQLGGVEIQGLESVQPDGMLGRLAMFADTTQERKMYAGAGLAQGDWFDVMEKRKLGETVNVVPVFGFISWVRFAPDSSLMYSVREIRKVPPGDLVWPEKGKFNAEGKRGPLAAEVWNYVVLVEGEPFPFMLRMKRTSLDAAKSIAAIEARYVTTGNGHRLYRLSHVLEDNEAKQTYAKATATHIGLCPESLRGLLTSVKASLATVKAQADKLADDADTGSVGGGNDDMPF